MRRFGLIGKPLSHSFSAAYFNQKFKDHGIADAEYRLYPLDSLNDLPDLIHEEQLLGFNVTIPYKEDILEHLDAIAPKARAVGAVNCVHVHNGKLTGYNTDTIGFEHTLRPIIQGKNVRQALVLGSGGSSRAVCYVLQQLQIGYTVVSRSGQTTYAHLTPADVQAHTLVINTTPLGMHPNVKGCPEIPYKALSDQHVAYDLVYNPEKTAFLKRCAAQGAVIQNGLPMLYAQADKSWEVWNA